MTPNRREFITGLAAAPLMAHFPAAHGRTTPRTEIWPEDHCLSRESAAGFRQALGCEATPNATAGSTRSASLIILPAAKWLSLDQARDLRERMINGASVILESGLSFATQAETAHQARICASVFGLQLLSSRKTADYKMPLYIEYTRPSRALVRTFEAVLPVCRGKADELARFGEHTVCVRKQIGRGGLVYLGSMLGPGLLAEEREALAMASELAGSARMRTQRFRTPL